MRVKTPFTTRMLSETESLIEIKNYCAKGCFVSALALICAYSKKGYASASDVASILSKNKNLFCSGGMVTAIGYGNKKPILTKVAVGIGLTKDGIANVKDAYIIRISNNGSDTHFLLNVRDVNTGKRVIVCPSYPFSFPSIINALRFYAKLDGREMDQIRNFPFDTDNLIYSR